ncbi:putative protein phosphatase 2C 23 [Dichanthelium oligosanthes]|uniref:Protein phosphatase n=1 Tax=Dichanthelium oligosanthes TaxID=888268 RepID=A0A1E5WG89_9POAL|nr:putative protein phosphatase 2C 23 [Dichanthelium oligosanthes]
MRIAEALRVAFHICYRAMPAPGGHEDEVANFAAVLLAPRDDDGASDSMDYDEPAAAQQGALRMVFDSCYIKDNDEDAHFGHAEAGVVGVADGVGSYRNRGVDASAFARGLMSNAYLEVATAAPGTHVCPRELLERAHLMTVAAGTPAASTAVIVSLSGRALKWAYVGDSGFTVFRDGRVLRRSRAQQYHFNCPYQLNSGRDGTSIAEAEVGEVPAKEGDIVVVGTDGLFDNVTDDELERIVRMGTALGFSPKNMAEVMSGFAFEAARCSYRDTPYSVLGRREPGKPFFTGGKPDDVTVVVAYIGVFRFFESFHVPKEPREPMEKLISKKTLREIDERIPDALRLAFGIGYRAFPKPKAGEPDEIANFAAVLLPPRAHGEHGGGGDVPTQRDDDVEEVARWDLRMEFASSYLKHHDEDAHFGHAEAGVVGVADGVGGYRDRGVDAAAFARELMRSAHEEAVTAPPGTHVCPHTLLERAYQKTAAAGTPAASTVAIVSLAGRSLRWAYVGDSGFAVFRGGRLLRRSRKQQRRFNCPLSLSATGGGTGVADAEVGEAPTRAGDVVVVGTDGLFDNVSDGELERIVQMGVAMGFSPLNMAEVVAAFAHEAARCTYRDTPYSVEKRKQLGAASTCGKRDDITVVIAFIVS